MRKAAGILADWQSAQQTIYSDLRSIPLLLRFETVGFFYTYLEHDAKRLGNAIASH